MLSLQEAVFGDLSGAGLAAGGILAFLLAFLAIFAIIGIALYIYSSFAYMAIAKRTGTRPAGIAWIPTIGPLLITSKIAKMHWWPILLLIGFWIPYLNWALMLAFIVFAFIWMWKTFIAVGRPGWWTILCLIPVLNLILLGIAAWGRKQSV